MKKFWLACIALLSLNACVVEEPVFCPSSNYTDALYAYLKDDPDLSSQREQMTDYISYCEDNNYKPSPGAYAHLGLLYSKEGDHRMAEECFVKEKTLFPESAHYIDFLMHKKATKSGKAPTKVTPMRVNGQPHNGVNSASHAKSGGNK